MNKDFSRQLKLLVYTALSAAMVALSTMVIKIPSPKGGYVNFGDIIIFIIAALMGSTRGFLAGGIGSAMADLILGYAVYAPATFIIKGLEGFICGIIAYKNKNSKYNIGIFIFAAFISAAWMVLGYFLYEYKIGGLLFANKDFGFTTAVMNLPGNIIQGVVSAAASVPFLLAIRRTKIFTDL